MDHRNDIDDRREAEEKYATNSADDIVAGGCCDGEDVRRKRIGGIPDEIQASHDVDVGEKSRQDRQKKEGIREEEKDLNGVFDPC